MSKHLEKEKCSLNEEKKANEDIAISRSMITEGNKRRDTSVSKKEMNETATANALIDSIQRSITSVQEGHTYLLGKQKKRLYEGFYKERKKFK